jgi:hypothetical protein
MLLVGWRPNIAAPHPAYEADGGCQHDQGHSRPPYGRKAVIAAAVHQQAVQQDQGVPMASRAITRMDRQ